MKVVRFGALAAALALAAAAEAQVVERLAEVRVHGNHTTPDADVLSIAALTVGGPVDDAVLDASAARLRQSGRFAHVEVRKRYRSIDDPSEVLVIILVTEQPGVSDDDPIPGPLGRLQGRAQWLPVLDYDEGYGVTYGARVSVAGLWGRGSRVSAPLTWGGKRRAAIEGTHTFARGPLTRLEGAASISRRVNPHFDIADTRREIGLRGERALTDWLRIGGGVRRTHVTFGGVERAHVTPAADVLIDTRLDPAFPRNALHVAARVEQLRFDDGARVRRWTADARGYVGLVGASVLALRTTHAGASAALPPYEQALLGGASLLRGFDAGARAGDQMTTGSLEIRLPLTSPVGAGRFGVKGFVDAGTVYGAGAALRDQRFDYGAGGGAFLSWTVLRAGLDVAWPLTGERRSPQWHFGLGVTF